MMKKDVEKEGGAGSPEGGRSPTGTGTLFTLILRKRRRRLKSTLVPNLLFAIVAITVMIVTSLVFLSKYNSGGSSPWVSL